MTTARREAEPTTRRRRDAESEPEFTSAPGLPRYIEAGPTDDSASTELMSLDPGRFDSVATSHALSSADAEMDDAASTVRDMSSRGPEDGGTTEASAESGVDGGSPESTAEDGGYIESSEAGEAGVVEGEAPEGEAEMSGAEAEGEGGGGGDSGAASGDLVEGGGGPAGPDPLNALATGDIALIDTELAEHLRWGAASDRVGAAGSADRAEYILQQVGGGALGGFAHAFGMGAAVGGGTRAAEIGAGHLVSYLARSGRIATRLAGPALARSLPLPAIGAVVGGVFSAIDLATRDWSRTGETIGRFGEGGSIYEQLANSIAAISEIIGIATAVLNVIGGIIGAISIVMWIVTVATAGVASPLAGTLSTIAGLIGLVSMILDGINALVLQRLVTVFRSLHTFTSQADPTDVEAQGGRISEAASATAGFLGGVGGGLAGSGAVGRGARGRGWVDAEGHIPDVDAPRPASGDGPTITADPPEVAAGDRSPDASPVDPFAPTEPPVDPHAPTPLPDGPDGMPEIPGPAPVPEIPPPNPEWGDVPDWRDVPPDSGAGASPVRRVTDVADTAAAPPPPEYHPQGWVPPEVDVPPPGFTPIEIPPLQPGELRDPASLFADRDNPRVGGVRMYDDAIPNRETIGTNPQRDHAIAQAEMQDRLRGPPGARAPEGVLPPVDLSATATVIAETGRATPTRPALPHTAATFHGPQADVPRITARRDGAPLSGHWSTDVIGPSRDVRLAAGYPESSLDVSVLDIMGEAHEQLPADRVRDTLTALEIAEGRAPTPDVPPDFDAAFPSGGHSPSTGEPPVWAVFDPATGEPRPATGPEVMDAIARSRRGEPSVPGQAVVVPRETVAPGGSSGTGGASGPLPVTDPARPVSDAPTRSSRPLSPEEFAAHARMVNERYGVPLENIQPGSSTAYHPLLDVVSIGPDVNPLPPGERPTGLANPANAALDAPSALAHEVLGHRDAELAGQVRAPDTRPGVAEPYWHEEFQASTRAALLEPDLSPEQRWQLMLDAEARRRHAPDDDTIFVWTEPGESSGARSTSDAPRSEPALRSPDEEPSVIINLDEPGSGGSGPRPVTDAERVSSPFSSSLLPAMSAGARSSEAERRARGGTSSASGVMGGAGDGGGGTAVEARTAPRAEGSNRSTLFRTGARALPGILDPGTTALYGAYYGSGTRESRIERGSTVGSVAGAILLGGPGGAELGSRVGAGAARRAEDFHEGMERGAQPIVEPVNPAYPPPPGSGSRQEIVDMQNRLLEILNERAQAEALEGMMCSDAEHHEANGAPLSDLNTRTAETITATQAHEQAIASRTEANQRQADEEANADSAIGDYADRAAGLEVIREPLMFFNGFTYLAHALPDSPEALIGFKRGMLQMNADSTNFLDAINGVDSAMVDQQTAQPQRAAEVEVNADRLEATGSEAETSQTQLSDAQAQGAALADRNDARASDSRQREAQAAQAGAELDGHADETRTEITDLSAQWQAWAQAHRQARVDAMAQTRAAMIERGWVPREESTGVP